MEKIKKYQSVISLSLMLFSVFLISSSIKEAETLKDLTFTFDAGIVIWFLYVAFDIVMNILATRHLIRSRAYISLAIAWNVMRNVLLTTVLGLFLRTLCIPMFEGIESEADIALRQRELVSSSIPFFLTIVIIYAILAIVVMTVDARYKKAKKEELKKKEV